MESIVKKPGLMARLWNALTAGARRRRVEMQYNDKMIETLERHIRIFKEVAERNGLDAGDDNDAAQRRPY